MLLSVSAHENLWVLDVQRTKIVKQIDVCSQVCQAIWDIVIFRKAL